MIDIHHLPLANQHQYNVRVWRHLSIHLFRRKSIGFLPYIKPERGREREEERERERERDRQTETDKSQQQAMYADAILKNKQTQSCLKEMKEAKKGSSRDNPNVFGKEI